jgi:hypothetical protein
MTQITEIVGAQHARRGARRSPTSKGSDSTWEIKAGQIDQAVD